MRNNREERREGDSSMKGIEKQKNWSERYDNGMNEGDRKETRREGDKDINGKT
jgi:hypothetical protein